MKLAHEVETLAQRLDGIEQAKAGAAEPGGDGGAPEDAGEQTGGGLGHLLGDAERQCAMGVDRAAEGDHAVDRLATAKGGGLIAEHAALRVTGEVDVATGRFARHGPTASETATTWSVKRALEPALFALGGAEVDDPGIDPAIAEHRDGARGRRDVVDVGGQHQRRHEQDRRSVGVGRLRRSSR